MIRSSDSESEGPRIITGLVSHRFRAGRLQIRIDDRYAFELSRKQVTALDLFVGEELPPERYAAIEQRAAEEAAIGLLARRERSEAELRVSLARKKFSAGVVSSVLQTLTVRGLQSDARFATSWVQTRQRLSPRGRTALVHELEQKGIQHEQISSSLRTLSSDDEREAIRALIAARWRRRAQDDLRKSKQQLLAFLARRGFSYEDIRAVLREHFPEIEKV